MRIHIHFDHTVDEFGEQTAAIKDVVKQAAHYWEKTLRVRKMKKVRITRTCALGNALYRAGAVELCAHECLAVQECGAVTVPREHLSYCVVCDDVRTAYDSCTFDGIPYRNQSYMDANLKRGVKTDFILYVARIECEEGYTAAMGAPCQYDEHDRPTAGSVEICSHYSVENKQSSVSAMKHEILHALGFTDNFFKRFRRDDGEPYYKRDIYDSSVYLTDPLRPVTRQVTREDWWTRNGLVNHTVTVMVTPRVVEEVRRHFACDTLEGAELENEGDGYTAGSHWDKRVFRNELMNPVVTRMQSVTSRVTLAMLEDSGWYNVDYSMADDLHWGKGLGCSFATKSCGEWISTRRKAGKSPYPFCDQVDIRGGYGSEPERLRCSPHRTSLGFCSLRNLVELNDTNVALPSKEYQYFTKIDGIDASEVDNYAGCVSFMDYCPYVQEFISDPYTCERPRGGTEAHYMQVYSASSRCIDFFGPWTQKGKAFTYERKGNRSYELAGGCYKTSCSPDALHVEVAGKTYICGRNDEGKKLTVEGIDLFGNHLQGLLLCPAYSEICWKEEHITDYTPPQDTPTHATPTPATPTSATPIQARSTRATPTQAPPTQASSTTVSDRTTVVAFTHTTPSHSNLVSNPHFVSFFLLSCIIFVSMFF